VGKCTTLVKEPLAMRSNKTSKHHFVLVSKPTQLKENTQFKIESFDVWTVYLGQTSFIKYSNTQIHSFINTMDHAQVCSIALQGD